MFTSFSITLYSNIKSIALTNGFDLNNALFNRIYASPNTEIVNSLLNRPLFNIQYGEILVFSYSLLTLDGNLSTEYGIQIAIAWKIRNKYGIFMREIVYSEWGNWFCIKEV